MTHSDRIWPSRGRSMKCVSIPQKSTDENESYCLLEVLPMMMPCGDLQTLMPMLSEVDKNYR